MITTSQLAESAGVSREYVRRLCTQGEIKAEKPGVQWLIPREEAERWLREREEQQGRTYWQRMVVSKETEMTTHLLSELGLSDAEGLSAIEYAEAAVAIYEQTIRAMGLLPAETISQTVDNSQLTYVNPPEGGNEYGDISESY